MFPQYFKTKIELGIEYTYKSIGVLSSIDLCLNKLSKELNIVIKYYGEMLERALWDKEFAIIFIKSKRNEIEKREVFFHELAHPLLHFGDKTVMKMGNFSDTKSKLVISNFMQQCHST